MLMLFRFLEHNIARTDRHLDPLKIENSTIPVNYDAYLLFVFPIQNLQNFAILV